MEKYNLESIIIILTKQRDIHEKHGRKHEGIWKI
jgi:hypothetical protein